MRSGLFLPLFGELADPAVVPRLFVEAEEAGWHGVFVRDHMRWREPVLAVGNPWITLAAVATATGRVRPGPMVDAAGAPAAGECRPGDRDAGPAQRRPSHARVGLGSDQFGGSSRSPAKNSTSGGPPDAG
jgi:hypothetical protein